MRTTNNAGDPASGLLGEVAERVRRIETRLVKVAQQVGADIVVAAPVFQIGGAGGRGSVVRIPTVMTTFASILNVIPKSYRGNVIVVCGDDEITTLRME